MGHSYFPPSLSSSMTFGTGVPTSQGNDNDTYIWTDDGTATGVRQGYYKYDKETGLWITFDPVQTYSVFDMFNNLEPINVNSNLHNLPQPPAGKSGYRMTVTSDRNLTGIDGGYDGQVLLLFNVSSNDKKLKLKHNRAGSAAPNRLFLTSAADGDLQAWESVFLRKDNTLNKWHRYGWKH